MKAALILLVGGNAAEAQLLQNILDSTGARMVSMADAASALAKMDELRPDLVLIGSGIPRDHAQWTLERMMASATLRAIPVVLVFYESSRSWVLEMIKLGLRAYIQLPRERMGFLKSVFEPASATAFSTCFLAIRWRSLSPTLSRSWGWMVLFWPEKTPAGKCCSSLRRKSSLSRGSCM